MNMLKWFYTVCFFNCISQATKIQFCEKDYNCDAPSGLFIRRCLNSECIVCSKYDYRNKNSKCYEIKDTCTKEYHCLLLYGKGSHCIGGKCHCLRGMEFTEEFGCVRKKYYCEGGIGCGYQQNCVNDECVCEKGKKRDGIFCRDIPRFCVDGSACGYHESCKNNLCQCLESYEYKNNQCQFIPGFCIHDNECSSANCDRSTNKCVCGSDYYLDEYVCRSTSMRIFKICGSVIVSIFALCIISYCCYNVRKKKKERRTFRASSTYNVESDHMPSSSVPLESGRNFVSRPIEVPQPATPSAPPLPNTYNPSAPPPSFNEAEDLPPSYDSVVAEKQ